MFSKKGKRLFRINSILSNCDTPFFKGKRDRTNDFIKIIFAVILVQLPTLDYNTVPSTTPYTLDYNTVKNAQVHISFILMMSQKSSPCLLSTNSKSFRTTTFLT